MRTRAIARAAGALALAASSIALVTSPAQAAAYRYWTYWQAPAAAGTWAFATQGPGTAVPADGDVEGWAFGVTTQSADPDDAPATAPDFAAVCADTAAAPDGKRVALIIDFGPAAVAPAGQTPPAPVAQCVVAAPDATGYDLLRSVAEVRTEDGLVCGVAGYPEGECAPVLSDAEAEDLLTAASASASPGPGTSTPSPSGMAAAATGPATGPGSGSPVAVLAVAALLLGGGALWYRGRRRES